MRAPNINATTETPAGLFGALALIRHGRIRGLQTNPARIYIRLRLVLGLGRVASRRERRNPNRVPDSSRASIKANVNVVLDRRG